MLKRIGKRCASLLLAFVMMASLFPASVLSASAASVEAVPGLTANGDFTEVDGGIEFLVYPTEKSGCSVSYENVTKTLTLTNTKDKPGTLSFVYEVKNSGGSVTIDGEAKTVNGTFTKELAANASVTIKVSSGDQKNNYGSVTLKNILLVVDEAITTTFQPAEHGSYTVDGEIINHQHTLTRNAQETTIMQASPDEGYRFYGWYSVTDQAYLSKNVKWTANLTKEQTVTAKFVPADAPVFQVGASEFVDLNEAVKYAQENGEKTIVLVADGKLPDGNYAIPSGKTLLIPYNDAHTVCTTEPVWHKNDASAGSAKAYRTLTMAAGANITVQSGGAISVAARAQNTTPNAGVVLGPWGMIQMDSGSSITVESGANLYCYGFITGQGSVLVKSGAKVYEDFQVTSFRGGNASSQMNGGSKNKVFPFTQFYIQNVEVPMTLEAGATETVCIGVDMTLVGLQKGSGVLIGKDSGLFQMTSGTVTKRYDGSTDRLIIEVNGTANISKMTVNMGSAGNIDSTQFVVPITNNMTVHVKTGASLGILYDMAMLPGSQMRVDKDASLTLASGKNLYVYDQGKWIGNGYATNNNKSDFVPLTNAPGKKYTRTSKDLADAELDINGVMTVNGYLYTTESGANITSSGGTGTLVQAAKAGTAAETYQVIQDGNKVISQPIAITPAQLKNAGPNPEGAHNPYTQTAGASAGDTFVFRDQTWDNQTQSGKVPENKHFPHVPEAFGEGKDATCAGEGLTTGQRCAVCGKVLEEQEPIEKTAHTYETVTWGEWTEPGEAGGAPSITAVLSCSVCDEGTEGHTIEAKQVKITADTTAASCTEGGRITYTASVDVDGETVTCNVQKVIEVEATGHNWDGGNATKAPTCTEKGEMTFTCQKEGCTETRTEAIEATGHQHTEAVEAAASTCHTKGNIAYWLCTDCDMKFEDKDCTKEAGNISLELNPENHTGGTERRDEKSATCSQEGYTGDTYCLDCEKQVETGKAIEKLPHTSGEANQENVVGATCVKPGSYDEVVYCTVCKEELSRKTKTGETLDHSWDKGKVTTPATCTTPGVKTFTCTVCKAATKTEQMSVDSSNHGNPETISAVSPTCTTAGLTAGSRCSACKTVIAAQETVPATGHIWNEGKVTTPATCTNVGVKTFNCTHCQETETAAIPVTGHTLKHTAAKDPTCVEPGNPEYWTCQDCGQYFSDATGENSMAEGQIVTPATGRHTEKTDRQDQTAATCTEAGRYTEIVTCSVCGKELSSENKTIPAAGHKEVTDAAKAATCTEPGLTEGSHCSVCREVLTAQETIPAKGHNLVTHAAKDPTCVESGWYAYETCLSCGYSTWKEERPATGLHTYGNPVWKWDGGDDAGYAVTAVFTCEVCRQQTDPINASVSTEYHAPTCTEDGTSTTYTAEAASPNGDTIYKDTKGGEKIDANGHTYEVTWSWGGIQETEEGGYTATAVFKCSACSDTVTKTVEAAVVRIEPTCTVDGSVTYTAFVNEDGLQAEGKTVERLPALGHQYVNSGYPATCTEPGRSERTCSRCSDVQSGGAIPAAGHSWGEWTVLTAAACETTGERQHTCSVCGTTESALIAKLGHTQVTDAAKPATCTEPGLTAGSHCSVCNKVIVQQTEISRASHSYGQPAVSWNRNEEGGWSASASFACSVCGGVQTAAHRALTHADAPDATCTQAGTRVFTAEFNFDGRTYTSSHSIAVDALGHDLVHHEAQAPACTETGWAAYEACTRCGYSTKGEDLPAAGHDYELQWTWTGEGGSTGATLNLVCRNDQTHAGSVQAEVTSETTPATTQAAGRTVYTARAVYDGVEYTAEKEVEISQLPSRPSGGGSGGGSYTPPSNPGSSYIPPSSPSGSYTPPNSPGEVEIDGPDTPLGGTPDPVTVDVADAPDGSGNKIITIKQGGAVLDKAPSTITASIPVENASSGMVAVMLGADGVETVIRKSVVDGSKLIVSVDGPANIAIRDNEKRFADVADTAWYASAVAFVSSHELFSGVSANTFAPSTTMSRAMLAQVLHNLENNPAASAEASFSDVVSGTWYEAAVAWANENQIVTGYSDGRFGSSDNISRQDMVVMLWRYAGKPVAKGGSLSFHDAGKVSGYAREAMLWAAENGIINGKGGSLLDPLGSATRAEVAKVIQNYLLYLVK